MHTKLTKIPIAMAGQQPANQSPAVRCDDLVYVSGQIGCDRSTGILATGLDNQTTQMLANLDAVLATAGCRRTDIVIVTLMFSDMRYFKRVDEIYAAWIPPREEVPLPGVNAFACDQLPGGAMVQIDAIAAFPGDS